MRHSSQNHATIEVKSSSYSLPGNSRAAFTDLPKAALLTSDPFPQGFNYFSAIPPSSKAGPGSFVPKGKTSHGVLLKWLLFRIFQCLLGNRDHPITMRHLP